MLRFSMMDVITLTLPSGMSLEVKYTQLLKKQIRERYRLGSDDAIGHDHIRSFILDELFVALKKEEPNA